jgi:hypothetical protein
MFALLLAFTALTGAGRTALGLEYRPLSFQEAVSSATPVAATLAAFWLLGRLKGRGAVLGAARTLVPLAFAAGATAFARLAEAVFLDFPLEWVGLDVLRAVALCAGVFCAVYLVLGGAAALLAAYDPGAFEEGSDG